MLIGFAYKMRAGKDTTCDYLCENYNFQKIAFADSLKNACREIFGLTEEQLYGSLKEVEDPYWKMTPRKILQTLGTDCLRNHFMSDIWARSATKKILNSKKNVCISDVRFVNEAQTIRDLGGFVVRIDRPQLDTSSEKNKHISETELDSYKDWDFIITNDKDFDNLYNQASRMIEVFQLEETLL